MANRHNSTEFTFKRRGNRKPTCHPERPYSCKGLCKECYGKKYFEDNKEELRIKKKKFVEENRPHLLDRYGITPKQYDEMFYKQGWVCAICGEESTGKKNSNKLCVDHDHETKKVRGLLCDR